MMHTIQLLMFMASIKVQPTSWLPSMATIVPVYLSVHAKGHVWALLVKGVRASRVLLNVDMSGEDLNEESERREPERESSDEDENKS